MTLQGIGDWLLRHQHWARRAQWCVIVLYVTLVALPAVLPLPAHSAHLWNNLTLMAQFAFWGVWWPFVLVSMVVVGRAWCGFFCPEGALAEMASRHGSGLAVPRWVSWGGWRFVAFACTTLYGQMVSVYQYPKPALLILGGSTVAAVAIGYFYGRNKRVWCRYLCPVNGVFTVLAKLAPVHFRVDGQAWAQSDGHHAAAINCAPLVPIRTMKGAGQCHMCGRCSGFRGAVSLSVRSPSHEIIAVAGEHPDGWETMLILFGMMGVAFGAFDWATSPLFVAIKQAAATWLVDHAIVWPLETGAPWWLLTAYPGRNDVMTLLDGAVLLVHILGAAVIMGGGLALCLAGACACLGRFTWPRFHHLAQSLIPLAGAGIFLGLSALTVSLLRAEGLGLAWVAPARLGLLAAASLWSLRLAWGIAGRSAAGGRRAAATAAIGGAAALAVGGWAQLFWG